jgi:hypothetical protein
MRYGACADPHAVPSPATTNSLQQASTACIDGWQVVRWPCTDVVATLSTVLHEPPAFNLDCTQEIPTR